MTQLVLLGSSSSKAAVPFMERMADHRAILDGYLTTLLTRNYSETTRQTLHLMATAARKARLELPTRFGWHSLRKSFATNFMELQRHPFSSQRAAVARTALGSL